VYGPNDTHFQCGHPITPENIRTGKRRKDGSQGPRCRTCFRASERKAYRKAHPAHRVINLTPEDFETFQRLLVTEPDSGFIDLLRGYTVTSTPNR